MEISQRIFTMSSVTPSLDCEQISTIGGMADCLNHSIIDGTHDDDTFEWKRTKVICIVTVGSIFSILTIGGNLMVMVSFKIDKQLQTISNYFLFSLAVADITIGIISIPLMTYYMAVDSKWGIGYVACQFWLCLDYFMSNASVLNLLLISFDRYFSVTRPLTYRPRRTAKKALIMIACTYMISLILWPPWIISWPYIEGTFMNKQKCVVQFIETNQYASVGTAIAAFYLPLVIMIFLYSRVYCETRRRSKEIMHLRAGQSGYSISDTHGLKNSLSCNSYSRSLFRGQKTYMSAKSSVEDIKCDNHELAERKSSGCWKLCLRKCRKHSEDSKNENYEVMSAKVDDISSVGSSFFSHGFPSRGASKRSTQKSPLASIVQENGSVRGNLSNSNAVDAGNAQCKRSQMQSHMTDRPLTYTVLIELQNGDDKRPSVRLSYDSDIFRETESLPNQALLQRTRSHNDIERKDNQMKKELLARPASVGRTYPSTRNLCSYRNQKDEQRKRSDKERRKAERKQESKAAKTLSAILFAFIITWTPYNVIVCWEAFYKNSVPEMYFHIGYCLCYINSTINPICYALCNARFRMTYLRILRGKWRHPVSLSSTAYLQRMLPSPLNIAC
ncbi:hypothetical protein AB6A40_001986 [Gnathostoma spinigerum]|uniref:G-protein coupled receptors family 1 profile domain-containing protein n=1 Tax=Gnathostoma spinigerum TaxID=75299 RepID=A0ABD6EFG4_9BILA